MTPATWRATVMRFGRFLVVGCINTAFGYAAFWLALRLGASLLITSISAATAGVIFNFFTTGGLVFRDLGRDRVLPFIAVYVVIIAVNTFGLIAMGHAGIRPELGQIILLPALAITSFALQLMFVFRSR